MGGSAILSDDWEFANNEATIVVLIGRAGDGKSSSGNSILGRKVFRSMPQSAGVTSTWLFDFSNDAEIVGNEVVKCIDLAKDGIHAVLLVLSVRSRFTREQQQPLRVFNISLVTKLVTTWLWVGVGVGVEEEMRMVRLEEERIGTGARGRRSLLSVSAALAPEGALSGLVSGWRLGFFRCWPAAKVREEVVTATLHKRKMTNKSEMQDTVMTVGATSIASTSRANAPQSMAPAEKLRKFTGIDFKRLQQKMFFYLTTLHFQGSLVRMLLRYPRKPQTKSIS
ncbi:hypothetical protein BC332_02172 [Capsicum chinense]|nr:hypothetical protein BC332_02172 [Capsicum chinense]